MTSPVHAADDPSVPLPGARTGRDPARAIKRGPRQVPAEVVAATQRERLFDALVHTVAEKGYANARVTDICTAAGVTRPAFYALFAGKEDAFLATYRYGTGVLMKLMDRAYADASDWRAGARAALGVLLDVLAGVPAFAAMAIVEIDAAGPLARQEREDLLGRFARFFADAPRPGDQGLPGDLIGAVVGGVYATIYRYVAAGRVGELPARLPVLSYFMMAPFLGRDAAEAELDVPVDPAAQVSVPCAEPRG